MKITTKNYRRIKSVSVELGDVTVIGAKNNNGKTSFIHSIIESLNGSQPYPKPTKADIKHIIHLGEDAATVEVSDGPNYSIIQYPDDVHNVKGALPRLSDYAAGVVSFLRTAPKQRLSIVSEIFNAIPTIDELKNELKDVPENDFSLIQHALELNSWDAVWDAEKTAGTKLKGAWEHVTGARYGIKIARGWLPAEWEYDLSTAHLTELEAEVSKLKEWIAAAGKSAAIDAAQRDRMVLDAEQLEQRREALKAATERLSAAELNLETTKGMLRALPRAEQVKTIACPHCKKSVIISDGKIEKAADPISDAEIAARKKQIDDVSVSVGGLIQAVGDLRRAHVAANAEFQTSVGAVNALEKQKDTPAQSQAELEKLQGNFDRAQKRLDMKRKTIEASKVAATIESKLAIVKALAPDGLRKKKAETAITKLNDSIVEMSEKLKWDIPSLSFDGEIYCGVPGKYLGRSASYKTDLLFNVAIALEQKSKLIIIDEADTLDKTGRNSLMSWLYSIRGNTRSIVALSLASKDELPNVPGLVAVWIEDGRTE
jgi:hypothetical protein